MGNPIDEDPELAKAVGVLAGRWGLLELLVELIFHDACGVPDRTASILFSFHKAVNQQRDVIRMLLREGSFSEDIVERAVALLNEYVDLAPERNQVIHFPFGWDTEMQPAEIYKMARFKSGPVSYGKVPMNAQSIMALAERVHNLIERMIVMQVEIKDARRKLVLGLAGLGETAPASGL